MDLTLDERNHKYMDEEGNIIPSVTEILSMVSPEGYRNINPAVLEHAAQKGRMVHEWCEQYDYGCADEVVPAELEPYCRAYMDFIRDYKPQWSGIEQMVYCNTMPTGNGFAGTVDRIGWIDGHDCIVDIKTIASPSTKDHVKVCCQTAAYSIASGLLNAYRYALYLKPDGKYRLMECYEYEEENNFRGYFLFKDMYEIYTKINEIGRKK